MRVSPLAFIDTRKYLLERFQSSDNLKSSIDEQLFPFRIDSFPYNFGEGIDNGPVGSEL